MRTESLRWLTCPAAGCAGSLAPGDALPSVWSSWDPAELVEGVLACTRCGAEYPVILGVALLEVDLQSYLWTFWSEIESCAASTPGPLSRKMRAYLGVPGAFTGLPGPSSEPKAGAGVEWTTSPYLQAHFDPLSLTDDLPGGWWRDALEARQPESHDPYTFLMEAVRELSPGPGEGLAVDVGTSVGRGSAELAGRYEYSLGVDRSFPAILAARRLLLGEPARLESYRVQSEKGRWDQRDLPLQPPVPNLDFVVSSGAALPVAAGGAACVAALNVLCAVSEPLALLEEFSRVLRPGAALLLSSPFWSESEPDGGSSPGLGEPRFLREAVGRTFDIVAENDMVPWLLRVGKRRWNVYLCHCVVATKR